jgi:glycolate oxidase
VQPEIVAQIKEIVGAEYVLDKLEDRYCYTYDASPLHVGKQATPSLIVLPADAEQVSRLVKLANRHRFAIVPRGAGSNTSGGVVPTLDAVVMVLTRMNRILRIDTRNMVGEAEVGVITAEFQAAVEKQGLFYPPDPASRAFCTLGGNVAENAGGPRCAKYGVTRDYILSLEVVLPTGEIIQTGAKTIKNVAGYDLTGLIVGSEGTLGVVTKITVKLLPLPRAKKTMLVVFDDLYKASETVAQVFMSGVIPATLELLDKIYIRMIEEYVHIGLPVDAEAVLLIEVDGDDVEGLDKQIVSITQTCLYQGATKVEVARDQKHADQLWLARRSSFAAIARVRPTLLGHDVTVLRDVIPELVKRIRQIGAKYNLVIPVLAHAGDGNLHAAIMVDERNHEEMERAERADEELYRAAIELGGTITGEHGIGQAHRRFLPWQIGEAGMMAMKAIKRALDPNNVLNPGLRFGD